MSVSIIHKKVLLLCGLLFAFPAYANPYATSGTVYVYNKTGTELVVSTNAECSEGLISVSPGGTEAVEKKDNDFTRTHERQLWNSSKWVCAYEHAADMSVGISWDGMAQLEGGSPYYPIARTTYSFKNLYRYTDNGLQMTYVIEEGYATKPTEIRMPAGELPVPGSGGQVSSILDQGQTGTIASNGIANLEWQGDSNLVLYIDGRALWSTNTQGNLGAYLDFQGDGNLVVYDWAGKAIWDAVGHGDRSGYPFGNAVLTLQEDCNLVLAEQSTNHIIWASNTSCVMKPVRGWIGE